MLTLGIHPGYHDAVAVIFDDYRMLAAVQLERLTRVKIDGGRVPDEAIDECLAIAGVSRADVGAVSLGRAAFPSRYYTHLTLPRRAESVARRAIHREKHKSMERELVRAGRTDGDGIFDKTRFLAESGFRDDVRLHFFNHHYAHALPCLFHTDWDNALLYTSDGGGDNVQYSHRNFRNGRIEQGFGGDEGLLEPLRIDSLGLAYGYATMALGYKMNRHEGKLTGLAAYGEPTGLDGLARHFDVADDGRVVSDFPTYAAMSDRIFEIARELSREDMAATAQALLEEFTLRAVRRLLEIHPADHLGLSGGVFGNVALNRRLARETGVREIFVYPAMSDSGLAAGGVLQFLLARDGIETWLANRYRLDDVYLGRDHGAEIDAVLQADDRFERVADNSFQATVKLLAEGRIVALYTKGMEFGPRALGARSILASPADVTINETLNDRLGRSEFMPFAPVIAAADVDEVFDLNAGERYAARFMTITCAVHERWRTRIPAVVHVDGTARPQIIERPANPLYFDILAGFKQATGLPVLINTSFNVHEEPIINAPAECAQALAENRIDYVATELGVYARRQAPIVTGGA